MALFYVYMRWFREGDSSSADNGRQLLTCSSRNAADEFFRALQTLRFPDGRLWYTFLERRSPQYWSYDSVDADPWNTVLHVLRSHPMAPFRNRIMSQLLSGASGGDWHPVPISDQLDWVHEGTYFIRNKRQPQLYWHYSGGSVIYLSETQKTKFRVCGTAFAKGERRYLIRSDEVEFRRIDESRTSYLSKDPSSNKLRISYDARTWKFGDLLGGFSTTYGGTGANVFEFLTCATDGDGDNWELC